MAFLTDSDYLSQISKADLDSLTDPELGHQYEPEPVLGTELDLDEEPAEAESAPEPQPTIREQAERTALSEAASYLSNRYDMTAAFAAKGSARNAQLVAACVDIAVWHLVPRATFRGVSEIRETRYKAAVKWLENCQAGKATPDLPRYPANSSTNPQRRHLFRWGSQQARSHSF